MDALVSAIVREGGEKRRLAPNDALRGHADERRPATPAVSKRTFRPSRRAFLAALLAAGCGRSASRVVVYCSQDREFAEGVFADFTAETGIEVVPRYDAEANKTVGLYREIVAEGGRPRCDVFWNNEILATVRLAKQGLLAPLDVDSPAGYPPSARAETWHAFAERARVLIVAKGAGATRLAEAGLMARPQYGTTATQTAALFALLGEEKAKALYLGMKAGGLLLAPGNKQVAEWVGQGKTLRGEKVSVGVTDTDDALDEVRAGRAVELVFPRDEWGTLFIPNTLCIPKGSPNPSQARRLVAYLLSPAVEKRLAEGPSGQLPLNADVKAELHPAIEVARTVKRAAVDWGEASACWDAAQEFVAKEFALA